ncbi:hypothetical protein BC939DRAFT_205245 [Gamsiella multidivaricata]|uniref:uncharacterized protein n=1 Tax=Gamsiella multidivaricata TaxID=101098 RepID=UPI00221F8B37|nr:uncharacterized protein BC939DRAFT_205245 [Gamsiella multidivaricata]KAI7821556.1 hypothetical protein BC939DRAFT_205245 [Gamsiella multidivaricata]
MAMMGPLPSPSSQTRPSLRSQLKDTVLPPIGSIDPELMERNQDMLLLPHLIDLGKELAHFTTTVARVVPPWPPMYDEEEESREEQNPKNKGRNGNNSEHQRLQELENQGAEGEEDIIRKVGRVCWDVIQTIQARVELSVQLEQEERLRAAAATGGAGPGMVQGYSKGKISREGFRDGEESYVVYEHYDGHDPETESFDGYGREYDSDDESFGQRSQHDMI